MSDMQRLRDYLNPGGWRVYEQIKAETRAEYYDINLRWLSSYLTQEQMQRKEKPSPRQSPKLFDVSSLNLHIADLSAAGAVIDTIVGRQRCIAAMMPPDIRITDEMLTERREYRARLKRDHQRVDALLGRAFG
jgi:hypothetical protein